MHHRRAVALILSLLVALVAGLTTVPAAVAAPAGRSAAAVATASAAAAAAAPAAPAPGPQGTFVDLPPTRVLDTRKGVGIATSLAGAATGALQVSGTAGIPSTASAVVLNLTVTNAARSGYVTAFPTGGAAPTASTLNFVAGDTIANLAVVRLSAKGSLSLRNGSSGRVDLVADVAGYYVGDGPSGAAGTTVPLPPTRILDTRSALGSPKAVAKGGSIALQVTGRGGVPATGAGAVILNLTAVTPATSGYVSAYPDGAPFPGTSNLNVAKGRTIAGLVAVSLGDGGRMRLRNATGGPLALLADVVGYVRAGEAQVPGSVLTLDPTRALDTRSGGATAVGPGKEVRVAVPQLVGLQEASGAAAFLNLTVTGATTSGYLTAYPGGSLPNASTLNFAAGQTISNLALVRLGSTGEVVIRNRGAGTVHIVADLSGIVLGAPLSIAAGTSHSCAVTPRGAVRCWGVTTNGALGDGTTATYLRSTPTSVVGIDEPVQKVVAGSGFGCALTTSGAVWCWGANSAGQLGTGDTLLSGVAKVVYPAGSGVLDLAAGALHVCAVRDGFGVSCWGRGTSGQLGSAGSSTTPKAVPGVEAVRVHAGSDFTCVETTTATVSCWGQNDKGQVGVGLATTMPPTTVPGLSPSALSLGGDHACAVVDGTVRCWGSNAVGQAGAWLGSTVVRGPQPVASAGTGLTWVEAGAGTTCAGKPGAASCWGDNLYGIAGTDTTTSREVPRPMPSLASVAAVDLGAKHACAVVPHASVACWGQSEFGQVGDGLAVAQGSAVAVTGLGAGVTALSAGPMHRCAIKGGQVICWGRNADGELGDAAPTAFPDSIPSAPVALPLPAVAVAAGGTWASRGYTCAALNDGSVRCWGDNASGTLGDGTTTSSTAPVEVVGLAGKAVALTAGSSAACALLDGGTVQCWGAGGQVGSDSFVQGTPATVPLGGAAISVSAGDQHACAVRSDHTVWCWGSNTSGQLGDGTTTSTFLPQQVGTVPAATRVSAGAAHSCAVAVDGGVWCWGSNNHGQVGTGAVSATPVLTPARVTSLGVAAVDVAADAEQTCVVATAGGGACWGYDFWGQTGTGSPGPFEVLTPSGLAPPRDGIARIDGGWWTGCSLTTAGAVSCWGARRWWLGDGTAGFYTAPNRVVEL